MRWHHERSSTLSDLEPNQRLNETFVKMKTKHLFVRSAASEGLSLDRQLTVQQKC